MNLWKPRNRPYPQIENKRWIPQVKFLINTLSTKITCNQINCIVWVFYSLIYYPSVYENFNLPLFSAFLLKVTVLTFAEEKKINHSKVLLLTENSLSEEFKNIDKRVSNALSARLADVRLGVITPETIISAINSNNQQKILSPYEDLTQNNRITLARQFGADTILSVNIDSFTNTKAEIPKFDRSVDNFQTCNQLSIHICFLKNQLLSVTVSSLKRKFLSHLRLDCLHLKTPFLLNYVIRPRK